MTQAARHRSACRTLCSASVLWIIALVSGAPHAAQAQTSSEPPAGPAFFFEGIIGDDDRIALDAWDPPFNAIGRLNVSGFSALRQCTGFLVAADVVLTAAHCVMDAYRGKPLAPGRFHFLPGWQRQKYLDHGIGKCIRVMEGFEAKREPSLQSMGFDVALIFLHKKIDITPLSTLEDIQLTGKTTLLHAGYSRDKQHLLMGDADCNVTEQDDKLVLTDCDTNRGASGGPVLTLAPDGEFKAVAMMVGGFKKRASIAVKLSAMRDFLRTARCE